MKCGTGQTKTDSTLIKDSTVEKTIERIKLKDTTIFITLPGPIQYLENPCANLCDSLGKLKPFTHTEKKNGIKSTVTTVGNVIEFNCEADSLKQVIKGLQEKIIEHTKFEKHTKEEKHFKTVPVHVRTPFERWCVWWWWLTVAMAALFIIYMVYSNRLR